MRDGGVGTDGDVVPVALVAVGVGGNVGRCGIVIVPTGEVDTLGRT